MKHLLALALAMVPLFLIATGVLAGEQTKLYDSRGNSIGTATRDSQGTTTFRDSRGNTTGTATTNGSTTTLRDSRGSVAGRDFGPCPSTSLACGRSR
jgi:hypothetical protein